MPRGVILCLLCHMVKLLMHSTMLHICKITYVAQLGINGHNCKIWSFSMIMLLHIRRFVSGIATTLEVGSTGASTILAGPFALWLWFNPQFESSVAWAQISYIRWHYHCSSTLDYDKLQLWWSQWYFADFHIVAQLTVLGITLKACKMLMCL